MVERDNSFEDELQKPLLVEESYTFDDKKGLKCLDVDTAQLSYNEYF